MHYRVFLTLVVASVIAVLGVFPVVAQPATTQADGATTSPTVDSTPITFYPVDARPKFSTLLNGTWKFKLGQVDEEFYKPGYDDTSWSPIQVPGNWELQGFENPAYGTKQLGSTEGFYRRQFTVPPGWNGRRVFIRFEGVGFGFEFWVNGKRAGAFASSFNRSEFDITHDVELDHPNTLAVRVTRRDKGWEFDTNDDWSLSGIHRDVVLFSLPETHLKDYTVTTPVSADGKQASVQLKGIVAGFADSGASNATLNAKVVDASGAVVASTSRMLNLTDKVGGGFEIEMPIASPKLWTAETPNLYRLDLDVLVAGQSVHQVSQRIGLRWTTIENGVFKLNGQPVKFRGVNHHDMDPETGRSMTRAQYIRDLELMKAANINAIRMSHYPPQKVFLDLCDEYGIYVIDEVPFGFGDEHLTDNSYQEVLAMRAKSTVARDKNQTCVLIWTIGNENPMTPMVVRTAGLVKDLDPSRPRCLAHPKGMYYFQPPPELDIIAPHYLASRSASSKMSKGSPDLEDILDKPEITAPVLMTEYAHAAGTGLEDLAADWEVMQKYDCFIGGCIWHFQDQGLYRKVPAGSYPGLPKMSDAMPIKIGKVEASTWVAPDVVIDTNGPAGKDGIVDADRFPQSDYWAVRKVYAPVFISTASLPVKSGRQSLSIPIENRYDFLNLSSVTGTWELHVDGNKSDAGTLLLDALPHQSVNAAITVDIPEKPETHDLFLRFAFTDHNHRAIVEHTIRLLPDEKPTNLYKTWLDKLPARRLSRSEQGPVITFSAGKSQLQVNQETGAVTFAVAGQPKVGFENLALRVGRVPQMGEDRVYDLQKKPGAWEPYLLTNPKLVSVKPNASDGRDEVDLTLQFEREYSQATTQPTEQAIIAKVHLSLEPQGYLDVNYELTSVHASDFLLELGLALKLPASSTRLMWLGKGPYPTYPAQPESQDRGVYSVMPKAGIDPANRMYSGNRTDVALAAATDDSGNGLGAVCQDGTVSLEPTADAAFFSHLVRVAGHGQKRVRSLVSIKASDIKHVTGNLQLIPLVEDQWPTAFQTVLAHPENNAAK